MGQIPDRVTYVPAIGKNDVTMKTQIARTRPNFRVVPSTFVDAKRTKYPITTKMVAGIRLKMKHIAVTSLLLNWSGSHASCTTRN
jgi:hypothetical protein